MSAQDRWIRKLCVVGGGVVGLSAALAFARALPRLQVTLIVTPGQSSSLADRAISSLPFIHRFHAAIGLDELSLIKDGIALHHLGTIFEDWPPSAGRWIHGFGEHGRPAESVPFHQIWGSLRGHRRADRFDQYSAAAILLESGKFVHPQEDPHSLLGTYLYGLRFDPNRYRARLEELAASRNIEIVQGSLARVERRDDRGVESLRLDDGRTFEADLYIDCTGPEALLRSTLDEDFEQWSDCLPCDQVTFGTDLPPQSPLPGDRVAAVPEGWVWDSTLPGRRSVGIAWSSAFTEEAEALRSLQAVTGAIGAERLTLRPGRRLEPWKHNVLALGDSAVSIDPLHGTNLHLAQSFILRALELIPGRDFDPLELGEYNRRTAQETGRVRDFLALQYLRSGRTDSAFWKSASRGRVPESLAHTLDQYGERGRLPFYEEETFETESWLALLSGLGLLPRHSDPTSDRIDLDQAATSMAQLAQRLAAVPERLPAYSDYLSRMSERASL